MTENPQAPQKSDRREFLKTLGAAGLAAAIVPAVDALAQATPAPSAPAKVATPAAPAAPEAPSADALALTAILRRRYPDRLSDAQWESVTRDFEGDLAVGKRLRALKLANSVEPDATFKA